MLAALLSYLSVTVFFGHRAAVALLTYFPVIAERLLPLPDELPLPPPLPPLPLAIFHLLSQLQLG